MDVFPEELPEPEAVASQIAEGRRILHEVPAGRAVGTVMLMKVVVQNMDSAPLPELAKVIPMRAQNDNFTK